MSTVTNQNPSRSAASNTYDESADSRPQELGQELDHQNTSDWEQTGSKFADKVLDSRKDGPVETSKFKTTEQKPVGER